MNYMKSWPEEMQGLRLETMAVYPAAYHNHRKYHQVPDFEHTITDMKSDTRIFKPHG